MDFTNVTASDCAKRQYCAEKHFCTENCFAQANETTKQLLQGTAGDFGKLVLLSSLCGTVTECYQHPAFDEGIPPCLVSLVLRCSHERFFADWLDLPLEEQWKAVREFLNARDAASEQHSTQRQSCLDTLVPPAARQPERELFLSDLELVLELAEK